MATYEKNIILNGALVHYFTNDSQNENKPIIFLHGWRSMGSIWLNFFDQLKNMGFFALALDLPGFGQSQMPKKNFCLRDYATIVGEFIKKLKLKNPVIVGHSFGGNIALKLALIEPSMAKSLVLVDASGVRQKTNKKNLAAIFAKIVKPLFLPSFMQPLRKLIYEKMGAADYLATPALQKTFLNITNEDLTESLKNIETKTLIIWGEGDKETPLGQAYILKNNLKNSRLVILKNAGHFPFLDQPDEFMKIITNYV